MRATWRFRAETFEEMANLSREHGMEMFQRGDEDHLRAMEAMKGRMQDPAALETWMAETKAAFEALPDVN